jgi:hypothetical protein
MRGNVTGGAHVRFQVVLQKISEKHDGHATPLQSFWIRRIFIVLDVTVTWNMTKDTWNWNMYLRQ